MRCGGKEFIVSSLVQDSKLRDYSEECSIIHHSRSTKPMTPILMPFDDVNMTVLGQPPRLTFSPSPGSSTFASNQGNVH